MDVINLNTHLLRLQSQVSLRNFEHEFIQDTKLRSRHVDGVPLICGRRVRMFGSICKAISIERVRYESGLMLLLSATLMEND